VAFEFFSILCPRPVEVRQSCGVCNLGCSRCSWPCFSISHAVGCVDGVRLCSSLTVRHQISDPSKTKGKIIVLWEQRRCRQTVPHDLRTHTLSLRYSMTSGREFGPPPILNIIPKGEIWGSHRSTAENTTLLGQYVISVGEQLPTFRSIIISFTLRTKKSKKNALRTF
jgi:hypothetical protein